MLVKKICKVCGAEFFVPHWRDKTAKYCSIGCQRKSLMSKPNAVCVICGKAFYIKPFRLKKHKHSPCCSLRCSSLYRKLWFRGKDNHQYGLKGDKNSSFLGDIILDKNNKLIDIRRYAPYRIDADSAGRVVEHRLLVEENWNLFNAKFFDVVNGQHVLKKCYDIHHIDGNHHHNNIENLMPLTRSEHRRLHAKKQAQIRDRNTGRFVPLKGIKSPTERRDNGYGSSGK